jgi:Cys-rich protein (TIGR01571 family)
VALCHPMAAIMVTEATASTRLAIRVKYNLRQTPCPMYEDRELHMFCFHCALCQEVRELHIRSSQIEVHAPVQVRVLTHTQ